MSLLLQLIPRHSPHAGVQRSPCFLQVQRRVSQCCLHEHQMHLSNLWGAAGNVEFVGTSRSFALSHSLRSGSVSLCSHKWVCRYALKL